MVNQVVNRSKVMGMIDFIKGFRERILKELEKQNEKEGGLS